MSAKLEPLEFTGDGAYRLTRDGEFLVAGRDPSIPLEAIDGPLDTSAVTVGDRPIGQASDDTALSRSAP